jgi:hypothetical protein
LQRPRNTHRDLSSPSRFGEAISEGFETGFQVGDALYRDLITQLGNAQHWHSGVFLGFTGELDGRGTLLGIHASNGSGWSDTIAFFKATEVFIAAEGMTQTMQRLLNGFIKAFADGRSNHPFHGARTTAGIAKVDRRKVAATATAFYGKNIWWTWVDMLDYKAWDWNGTVDDIDETRCDGVVEYSYEKHNLKVCEGRDARRWQISKPGSDNVENHEDFHNGAYQRGELCPRIQAGDGHGNDTAFIAPSAARPLLDEFSLTSLYSPSAVAIQFTVFAPHSEYIYARLLVRRSGEAPFHLVRTDDYALGPGAPLIGDWQLMKAIANGPEIGVWMGKTAGGPDYSGQDGTYEFRLQVIDEGGNVSNEHATEITVTW